MVLEGLKEKLKNLLKVYAVAKKTSKEYQDIFIKAYKVDQYINVEKQEKIVEVIREYRKAAKLIANEQWFLFWQGKKFNKDLKVNRVKSALSERYKQTCQYQVLGTLKSYLENRKEDFKTYVYGSSVDEETRIKLLYINKYERWFLDKVKMKGKEIEPDIVFLAKNIIKQIFKKNNLPSFKKYNLALDAKVAELSMKGKSPKKTQNTATGFDYWIRFSTVQKGKVIQLPIKSNYFFETAPGYQKNFVQININENNKLSVYYLREQRKAEYEALIDKISIDIGLKELFAVNDGSLFARDFYNYLLKYDKIINKLAAQRQKHGLKTRCPRYDKLINKVRNHIKNTINRSLNRIVDLYKPQEIVLEKLDFRHSQLSKRLNRIIRKFGKNLIKQKLESLTTQYGIIITEVNPAYTSQECSKCGYVDKRNRSNQKTFKCKFCLNEINADVNASRNHFTRSSGEVSSVYISKDQVFHSERTVLLFLIKRFIEKWESQICRSRSARDVIQTNPYFTKAQLQLLNKNKVWGKKAG